jgi:hypothetical protein
MTRSGLAVLALGILLATPSLPAGAQGVRGLIKKQAAEAVKGPEAAKTAEVPEGLRDPDVIPMTEENLGYFKRGLQLEVTERAALTKFMAGQPAREQAYRKCTTEIFSTPEGQKIALSLGNLPENATVEQLQAASQKMGEQMKALTDKKCGEDPSKYNGEWQRVRLREIEEKAAAAAGPPGDDDAATWSSPDPSGFEGEQEFAGSPAMATAIVQGLTTRQYGLMKERVVAFCQAVKAGWKPPSTPIVKLPGSGSGVWVFTQDEVQDLLKQCDDLMFLLTELE